MNLGFKGCRAINDWIKIIIILYFASVSPLLSQNIVQKEMDSLRSIPQTEESLKALRKIIYEKMGSDPKASLAYISLYEELINTKEDKQGDIDKINELKGGAYNQLAWRSHRGDKELALSYIDTSQTYYDLASSEAGTWKNQYGRGTAYRMSGENEMALEYFDSYLNHYKDPFDSSFVSNVQFQRAVVLLQMGKLDEATRAIQEAIQLDERLGRKSSQANCLNTLANIYKKVNLNIEAENAYQQAIDIYRDLGSSYNEARILLNWANLKVELNEFPLAKSFLKRALWLTDEGTNIRSYIDENLGNLFLMEEQIDSAQYHLAKSYIIRKEQSNDRELGLIEHKLGRAHLLNGDLNEAFPLLTAALQKAQEAVEPAQIEKVSLDLVNWHESRGNSKMALTIYKDVYQPARDSLLNTNLSNKIAELNTKYETDQREQEIAILSAQNETQQIRISRTQRTLFGVIGILVIIGLLSFQIFRSKRNIQKMNIDLEDKQNIIAKALKEKDVLLREIHHRVKNNLQVISSLLGLQTRTIKDAVAKSALQDSRSRVLAMSLIHQNLYKKDDISSVNARVYIKKLLEHLSDTYSTNTKIIMSSDIADINLDVETLVPLGLIINELVTNSFKYAFVDQGTINVSLQQQSTRLILLVKDDGKGIIDINHLKSSKSYGYELINALVDQLEGTMGIQIENGTQVSITLSTRGEVIS